MQGVTCLNTSKHFTWVTNFCYCGLNYFVPNTTTVFATRLTVKLRDSKVSRKRKKSVDPQTKAMYSSTRSNHWFWSAFGDGDNALHESRCHEDDAFMYKYEVMTSQKLNLWKSGICWYCRTDYYSRKPGCFFQIDSIQEITWWAIVICAWRVKTEKRIYVWRIQEHTNETKVAKAHPKAALNAGVFNLAIDMRVAWDSEY